MARPTGFEPVTFGFVERVPYPTKSYQQLTESTIKLRFSQVGTYQLLPMATNPNGRQTGDTKGTDLSLNLGVNSGHGGPPVSDTPLSNALNNLRLVRVVEQ